MFLGYLLDKNGSIIGEVYSGAIENSVGALCQALVLLFMGVFALASAYIHITDIKNCLTEMPFFWVLLICFIILNIFNARRIIDNNEGFFFQSLSVITSGSLIGGFLLSMAYKPYYLQFHNNKLELIDGVGRFLGSVFIVSLICISTLIFGFIIAYKQGMGLRIKNQRKALNFTQEALAEQLDVSVKHFSEVERGLSGLSIENLIRLSSILGVSIDYIVKGEEDKDKWECILSILQKVPKGKEELIKELINLGIELSN